MVVANGSPARAVGKCDRQRVRPVTRACVVSGATCARRWYPANRSWRS